MKSDNILTTERPTIVSGMLAREAGRTERCPAVTIVA